MELWEVLDKEGNRTGEIMKKNEKGFFERGFCHLGAEIWIINSENKILLQKRSPNKYIMPNLWAMIGGSVILGEDSKQTLVRELKEELNIDIDSKKLKFISKFRVESLIVETYILKCNYEITDMKLKKDEVSEVAWMTVEEIEELMKQHEFFENRKEVFNKVKEEIMCQK